VPSEDIIYTNSEDQAARIPEGYGVFDYLKDFFVDSSSKQKIYLIFVTSKKMEESWGAVLEAGAGWITKTDHKIFNIEGYNPKQPLNTSTRWHTSTRKDEGLSMTSVECDDFAVKIEAICDELRYIKKDRACNKNQLKQYFTIEG